MLLVLVLALGAAGTAAELLVRSQVGTAVRSALPGLSQDAEVSTEGVLLLQLASGSLRTLTVEASGLDLEGAGGGSGEAQGAAGLDTLSLSDVTATVSQVGLRSPYTASSIKASGTISWDQLGEMVGQVASGLSGAVVGPGQTGTSAQDPGTIVVQTSSFGIEGTADVVPSVGQDGGLVLTVQAITTGGVRTDVGAEAGEEASALLASLGMTSPQVTFPAEDLPKGLTVSEVLVTDGGLRIGLAGSDVDLAGT